MSFDLQMGSHWVGGSDSIFIDLKSYQSLLHRVGKSGVFCVLGYIVTVHQLVTNYKLKRTGVLKKANDMCIQCTKLYTNLFLTIFCERQNITFK